VALVVLLCTAQELVKRKHGRPDIRKNAVKIKLEKSNKEKIKEFLSTNLLLMNFWTTKIFGRRTQDWQKTPENLKDARKAIECCSEKEKYIAMVLRMVTHHKKSGDNTKK